MSEEYVMRELVTSFHKNHLNKMIDECTGKTLDIGSSRLIKEAIDISMNQICDAFIGQIKKLKRDGGEDVPNK